MREIGRLITLAEARVKLGAGVAPAQPPAWRALVATKPRGLPSAPYVTNRNSRGRVVNSIVEPAYRSMGIGLP